MIAGVRILPRTTDLAMPHVWDMVGRLLEPVTRQEGSPPLWGADRARRADHAGHRCRRLAGRSRRRHRPGSGDAALAARRVGPAALDHPQPDGAADRLRTDREELGLAHRDRRRPVAGLDVGRADRLLPRVLPHRRRRAARAAVARPHPHRADAHVRRRILADAAAAEVPGIRPVSPARASPRRGQRRDRRRGRGGLDRAAGRHRAAADPVRRAGVGRPVQGVGADLRRDRARAGRGRFGRAARDCC